VTLSVTAAQGQNAPGLRVITIGLPAGLMLDRSKSALHKGLRVSSTPGSTVTASFSGANLTLSFAAPFSRATVTIKRPLVTVSKALRRRLGHHHKRPVQVAVTLTNASGGITPGSFTVTV
jgi:hypothetical protein